MAKVFFIIAGEASGDLLGSKLIRELKLSCEDAKFIGVGGPLMKAEGLESIFPIEDLSVMGFLEVLPHIPKLLNRISQTCDAIIKNNPDYLITVDAPDFCFRVVKKFSKIAKNSLSNSSKIKFPKRIHLIAPSVWAYREGRAKKISKFYDLLLAILPFEPPYFEKYGLKTVFIGHPLIEDSPNFLQKKSINDEFRKTNKILTDDILIFLTPGSRMSEVRRIFPEFIGAINQLSQKFSNLKIAIPLLSKTRDRVIKMAKEFRVECIFVEQNEKKSALFSSNYALAKSGTNSIEISLFKIPMIIAYKINALTHILLRIMVKIKFANLLNLILNREIIPEMLQKQCEATKLAQKLQEIMTDKNLADKQLQFADEALQILGLGIIQNPMKKAANEIIGLD